jgi:hypothetical protein
MYATLGERWQRVCVSWTGSNGGEIGLVLSGENEMPRIHFERLKETKYNFMEVLSVPSIGTEYIMNAKRYNDHYKAQHLSVNTVRTYNNQNLKVLWGRQMDRPMLCIYNTYIRLGMHLFGIA